MLMISTLNELEHWLTCFAEKCMRWVPNVSRLGTSWLYEGSADAARAITGKQDV